MNNKRELFQILARRIGLFHKSCCNYKETDISLVQSHILFEIKRQHRPSMQQVAEALGMDITTFSRQIQTLVNKDLIHKAPDPNDRRIFLLSLSSFGKAVENQIDREMNHYLNEVFSFLSKNEQEIVLHSIKLLNDATLKSNSCCLPFK